MHEPYIYRYIYLMYDDLPDDFNMSVFSSEVKGSCTVLIHHVLWTVHQQRSTQVAPQQQVNNLCNNN